MPNITARTFDELERQNENNQEIKELIKAFRYPLFNEVYVRWFKKNHQRLCLLITTKMENAYIFAQELETLKFTEQDLNCWLTAALEKPPSIFSVIMQLNDYCKDKKNYHSVSEKKPMLDKLMEEIITLKNAGQTDKMLALSKIYNQFKAVNLRDQESLQECRKVIVQNLSKLNRFHSTLDRVGSWIKQSFFQNTGYKTTMTDTRLLVGKLSDWLDAHAKPRPAPRSLY